MSELLEDELLTNQELDSLFEGLPKAGDGSSIDLAGFVEFSRKVGNSGRASVAIPFHLACVLILLLIYYILTSGQTIDFHFYLTGKMDS